jgi:hypothetical protein
LVEWPILRSDIPEINVDCCLVIVVVGGVHCKGETDDNDKICVQINLDFVSIALSDADAILGEGCNLNIVPKDRPSESLVLIEPVALAVASACENRLPEFFTAEKVDPAVRQLEIELWN